jgi:hypothetical protein
MAKTTPAESICDKLKQLSPDHLQLVARLVDVLSRPDVKPAVMQPPRKSGKATQKGQVVGQFN